MRFDAIQAVCPVFRRLPVWAKTAVVVFALYASARAEKVERPSAMKLFPEETVVFVRVANAHEFGEKFQQTSMGRMIRDLYAQHAEDKVGISWDDLKKLPKGEVAFAVIARDHGRPGLLLLVDQGDEVSVADKLVDKALDFAEKQGGEFSKEKIGDVEITVVRDHDHQNRMFGVFERDNTIVVATDPDLLRNSERRRIERHVGKRFLRREGRCRGRCVIQRQAAEAKAKAIRSDPHARREYAFRDDRKRVSPEAGPAAAPYLLC
jgi:hypothetical protein